MNISENKRKIVVGDIHGELEGFREILNHAGLINGNNIWTGGDSILIQTGDVIDRGPYSLESVNLLQKLQKQAAKSGGEVIRLCGNHELMIMEGSYYFANFPEPEKLAEKLKEEIITGDLKASYTDGRVLYTHAGLTSGIREELLYEMDSNSRLPLKALKL